MRRRELLIFGGVAIISGMFSFVLSGAVIGSPKKQPIKVPVVQTISTDFPVVQTDKDFKKFFNEKAIDPTQLIKSGGGNTKPFQGGQ